MEIDEAPLSLGLPSKLDYVGRMMLSALHSPLLQAGGGGAAHLETSTDLLRWDLTVCAFRSEDGTPLTSSDALEALRRAARSPYWGARLARVAEIRARGAERLRITLREPDTALGAVLSAVDLSPVSADRNFGPYRLAAGDGGTGGTWRFDPNPYYPGHEERPGLEFQLHRDSRDSPVRFERGELDVTCNTSFPLSELPRYCGDPRFVRRPSGIWMELRVNPRRASLARKRVRQGLNRAIDRHRLARALGGYVRAAQSYGPECFPAVTDVPVPQHDAQAARELCAGLDGELSVGFNAYFPNHDVLLEVAAQLREVLGLDLRLDEIPFENEGPTEHDLFLWLAYPAYPHPSAVLYDAYLAPALAFTESDEEADSLRDVARRASLGTPAQSAAACRAAMEFVADLTPAIPLCHVDSLYLVRPGLVGAEYPSDAAFDFRRVAWTSR